jgi:hypothetical protein
MEYDPEASAAQEKSSEINEQAWNVWLEKGRRQDRMRLRRLRATIYVLVILAACAGIWIYLPFSQNSR